MAPPPAQMISTAPGCAGHARMSLSVLPLPLPAHTPKPGPVGPTGPGARVGGLGEVSRLSSGRGAAHAVCRLATSMASEARRRVECMMLRLWRMDIYVEI